MATQKSSSNAKVIGLTVSVALASMAPAFASAHASVKDRLAQVRAIVGSESGLVADQGFAKRADPAAIGPDEGFAKAPEPAALDTGFANSP